MGNQKRARTRAVRAEMAKTGDNYTRAATRSSGATSSPQDPSRTDVVREHVRRLLEADRHGEQARLQYAEALERAGHRIVDGGQTGPDTWAIYDWRTNQLLAKGDGGIEEYDAEADRLDPDGKWFFRDNLHDEVPLSNVETPGVPPSLGQAIEEWIGMVRTPDEEIAEFVGWPVEKVSEHRDQLS